MILIDFLKRFPSETECRNYLKLQREKEGISCKKCKNKKHYWLERKQIWKCAKCGSTTNLRAGTIMEKSKLPIMYWFITIHLMTSIKKSFSALELQRQLGHSRYEPIWYMMNKVRIAMGKRDQKYSLKGEIEVDDAFFVVVKPQHERQEEKETDILKRGRGSQKQLKVMVMVESTDNSDNKNKHRPSKKLGYVKMVVMDNLKSVGINFEIERNINKNSEITTDGWRGYRKLKEVVSKHNQLVVPPKEADKKLPWVHTIISNAKRLFLGTHHSIGKDYLQNYLNEFCYKLNRRYMSENMFDRMLTVGANDTWY